MLAGAAVAGLVALALAVWGVDLFVRAAGGGTDTPPATIAGFGVALLVCAGIFAFVARGLLIRRRRRGP